MRQKLAIVGSGISAMTVAYYLRHDYDISIFDKNDYLGGHTHTHVIDEGDKKINIDTGFIVFNKETYPNMFKLFTELGVENQESNMGFAVYNISNGLQYAGSNLSTIFAQRKNIFNLRYWQFLLDIKKFFKVAKSEHESIKGNEESIKDYCKRHNIGDYFLENYLGPMSSAVWSVPHKDVFDFPIALLLPFFYNHGLLSVTGQFQWYSVKGGSNTYTKKIIENADYNIHLNEKVESVYHSGEKVRLETKKAQYDFDYVVLASHSDESLKITKDLDREKQDILKEFGYNPNTAVLHTDVSIMPPIKKTWSAWNQLVSRDSRSSTVYWMNVLQKLDTKTNYFVSINPIDQIDESKIIKTINYMHPNFTTKNFAMQNELKKLNQDTRVLFAGAYFGYGFHEDGLKSGLELVKILKK